MTGALAYHAAAFGLRWLSDIPLMHFEAIDPDERSEADVRVARATALAQRTPLAQLRRGQIYADGTRFPWEAEAVFDTHAGTRVDYLPGPNWNGVLPHAFYGTVAAHILAWRGLTPLHACAVELGGKAVLIAGTSGAGKSSLTAGLLGCGAALVSDDLTAIAIRDGVAEALPGRTTIRLGPEIACWTAGEEVVPPSPATRGKHVVRPAARISAARLPLAGLLLLGAPIEAMPPAARGMMLAKHLFRPVWLAALPGHRARQQALLELAARLPVIGFPAVEKTGEDAHRARARDALALAETLVSS
ncbi:hypothetical protein [Sphingomonas sp. MS122]|uniref:hypothetical protein n=1 Tax=Sphingomonas sp. MS122 TaxID=3412683 RepID=UPI003C2B3483